MSLVVPPELDVKVMKILAKECVNKRKVSVDHEFVNRFSGKMRFYASYVSLVKLSAF